MRWAAILAAATLAAGQEKPLQPPVVPADGVNLLQLIDLTRDAVHGDWKVAGPAIASPHGVTWARVQVPYIPPEEYDLTLVVERKEGKSSLEVGLASGARQFHVGLDAWGTNDITGLCLIDGKANNANETTFQGKLLPQDTKAKIGCSVRKTGVATSVDGKSIFDWKGDLGRLTAGRTWEVPGKETLFIGSYATRFLIHEVVLVPVSGRGRALREWTGEADLLARVDPQLDSVVGAWSVSEGKLVSAVSAEGAFASCALPYVLPPEYDVTIVAERRQGKGALFMIGGGNAVGLSGDLFSDGKTHSMTSRVRKLKTDVTIDGKDPGDARLRDPKGIVVREAKTLHLATGQSEYVFHRLTIVPVNGAGIFVRSLDPTPFIQSGDGKIQAKDYRGASEDFSRAIGADPAFSGAWAGRGLARKFLGDLSGALADFSTAVELNGKDGPALVGRGTLLFEQRDLEGAMADATRALTAAPSSAAVWHLRAQIYHARGDYALATSSLDREIALDPRAAGAFVLRAIEKLELKDAQGALADLDQAIKLDPSLAEAFAQRSKVRIILRDVPGANADVEKALELKPGTAAAYQLRGSGKYEMGDSQGALADCAKALELDPGHVWTHQTLGYTHRHLGDYASALKDFERALELDPKRAMRWSHRASVRRALGDTAGALADYSRAIEIQPTSAGYADRAELRRDIGDLDGALTDATQAIALTPDGPTRSYLRGCIYFARGEFEKAEQDLTKAISLFQGSSLYYRMRAQVRIRARNVRGANDDLNKSIQVATGERDANHEERAIVREYLGDIRGARGDAWWAVYYGERHGHGAAGLDLLRRLEMDR